MFSSCSASRRSRRQGQQRVGGRHGALGETRRAAARRRASARRSGRRRCRPARRRRMRRRASALGTASVKLRPVVCRRPSKLPKKNVLLRTIGPPIEPPNWSSAQLLLLVVVLAGRVERVVAHVVEQRAAEAVAAALADDRDVAAGAEAAFGRRQARVHAELRDRLHRRLQAELRARRVQVAGAGVPHIGAVDAVVVQVVLLVRLAVEPHAGPPAVAVARGAGARAS